MVVPSYYSAEINCEKKNWWNFPTKGFLIHRVGIFLNVMLVGWLIQDTRNLAPLKCCILRGTGCKPAFSQERIECDTWGLEPTEVPYPLRNRGYSSNFLIFWKLRTFHMKNFLRQKYSGLGAPGGVTKVGSPKIFFERCLRKNFNCGQDTNDKDIFFCKTNFR